MVDRDRRTRVKERVLWEGEWKFKGLKGRRKRWCLGRGVKVTKERVLG